VVIGLGSNLGQREAFLARATERIGDEPELCFVARAGTYESAAVGGPPQGDYLNSAVLVVTAHGGAEILRRMLAIERALGRERPRGVMWAPRTIDLDILWIEGEVIATPELCVPHPRLLDRPFALRPLLDLVPEAIDPRNGTRLGAVRAAHLPIALVGLAGP
jgi:2-amino-4-hydroxy-6-hydroxymethyldihydropteridine diphosphokinase